ncbi:hypothetical protein M0R72_10790 [Candidatus Pacearchaeota archaeon]|jgi:Mg-chelatase subunit ChlD|nr:hypothetical protein [Candidatus Pacearchaeota archaeon]
MDRLVERELPHAIADAIFSGEKHEEPEVRSAIVYVTDGDRLCCNCAALESRPEAELREVQSVINHALSRKANLTDPSNQHFVNGLDGFLKPLVKPNAR